MLHFVVGGHVYRTLCKQLVFAVTMATHQMVYLSIMLIKREHSNRNNVIISCYKK